MMLEGKGFVVHIKDFAFNPRYNEMTSHVFKRALDKCAENGLEGAENGGGNNET